MKHQMFIYIPQDISIQCPLFESSSTGNRPVVYEMLVTLHLSTSLQNCAGNFISTCTKNVQETSLGHPLYVFCSAGNSTFCPVVGTLIGHHGWASRSAWTGKGSARITHM